VSGRGVAQCSGRGGPVVNWSEIISFWSKTARFVWKPALSQSQVIYPQISQIAQGNIATDYTDCTDYFQPRKGTKKLATDFTYCADTRLRGHKFFLAGLVFHHTDGGQVSTKFFLNSSFAPGFLYQKAVKRGTILLAVLS